MYKIGNCPKCDDPVFWDEENEICVFHSSTDCLCECPFPDIFMNVWREFGQRTTIEDAWEIFKTGTEFDLMNDCTQYPEQLAILKIGDILLIPRGNEFIRIEFPATLNNAEKRFSNNLRSKIKHRG